MIKFVGGFDDTSKLPNTAFAEYAFVGRSNVGKSSLINAIVRENIARTSKTPGRTQTMNFFNIGDRIMIVDLPGYGYARVARERAISWVERLDKYLRTRRQLKRLFILIDSRIGPRDADLDLMDFCDTNAIPYQIVYTKIDKRIREKDQIKLSHETHGAMIPQILETSAEKRIGIDGLRAIIGIK